MTIGIDSVKLWMLSPLSITWDILLNTGKFQCVMYLGFRSVRTQSRNNLRGLQRVVFIAFQELTLKDITVIDSTTSYFRYYGDRKGVRVGGLQ